MDKQIREKFRQTQIKLEEMIQTEGKPTFSERAAFAGNYLKDNFLNFLKPAVTATAIGTFVYCTKEYFKLDNQLTDYKAAEDLITAYANGLKLMYQDGKEFIFSSDIAEILKEQLIAGSEKIFPEKALSLIEQISSYTTESSEKTLAYLKELKEGIREITNSGNTYYNTGIASSAIAAYSFTPSFHILTNWKNNIKIKRPLREREIELREKQSTFFRFFTETDLYSSEIVDFIDRQIQAQILLTDILEKSTNLTYAALYASDLDELHCSDIFNNLLDEKYVKATTRELESYIEAETEKSLARM